VSGQSSWFSKASDELDCGYYCGKEGLMDGKWCKLDQIAQLVNVATDRVLMGKNAMIEEIPWQVQIMLFNKAGAGDGFCGGSILNKNWVLTAAHCFYRGGRQFSASKVNRIGVGVGSNDKYLNSEHAVSHHANDFYRKYGLGIHSIKRFIIHPDYKDEWKTNAKFNDIALIELKTPIKYPEESTTAEDFGSKVQVYKRTSLVRPVCLPHPTPRSN